jgi:hypothetical protein
VMLHLCTCDATPLYGASSSQKRWTFEPKHTPREVHCKKHLGACKAFDLLAGVKRVGSQQREERREQRHEYVA